MASVNVTNIVVLDNPAPFTNPLQFEITFECVRELSADLEWRLTYVGSAEDEKHDQQLDSVLVGPVPVGINRFVFQCDPPNPKSIPRQDLLGVTVIFISCYYQAKEFIRVGYYVSSEYDSEELNTNPPETPAYEQLVRNILADKPRVTRYQIDWSN